MVTMITKFGPQICFSGMIFGKPKVFTRTCDILLGYLFIYIIWVKGLHISKTKQLIKYR